MPHSRDDDAGRVVTYCLVPGDLAPKLHDLLRKHFADDPGIEVVIERRTAERRTNNRRTATRKPAPSDDRRLVRNVEGRRLGEHRVPAIAADTPELPRRVLPHAGRLVFVARVEPSTQQLEDVDSARVVMRIHAGDKDAFAEIYTRYFDRVYSYLRIALRDPHTAEDVTQDVFFRVLQALPRYEFRGRPFRAWLFVIVRNCALTQLRRSDHEPDLLAPADLDRATDVTDVTVEMLGLPGLDWVSDRDLVLLIERLPIPQRQVLLLRYALDMDNSQIAEVLGYSADNVRQLQTRALAFLHQRLAAMGRSAPRGTRIRMGAQVPQGLVIRARRFALVRW